MKDLHNTTNIYHAHLQQEDIFLTESQTQKRDFIQKLRSKIHLITLFGEKDSGKTAFIHLLKKDHVNSNNISQNNLNTMKCIDCSHIRSISHLKKAISLTQQILLKEQTKVITGEIISKTSTSLTLKTDEMESTFSIRLTNDLQTGDIIQIINGHVQKIGIRKIDENTDPNTEILTIPKGKIIQTKLIQKKVSAFHLKGNKNEEYFSQKLTELIDKNEAEMLESTLILNNAHLLDKNILHYISQVKKNKLLIILISRYKLDNTLNIKIEINQEEQIIENKLKHEQLTLPLEIKQKLIQNKYGLKFKMQLLTLFKTHSFLTQKSLSVGDCENIMGIYCSVERI